VKDIKTCIKNLWYSFAWKKVPYKDNIIILSYETRDNGYPMLPYDKLQEIHDSVAKRLPKEANFIMLPDKIMVDSWDMGFIKTLRDSLDYVIKSSESNNSQE
jgi:hypothetical protein